MKENTPLAELRPWLRFWHKNLPLKLDYPEVPLFDIIETSYRRYPDKASIIYYGNRISYKELWISILRLSGHLKDMGVVKGDRVALFLENSPHFIISFFAAIRANGIAVPINPLAKGDGLKNILEDTGCKIAITTANLLPQLRNILDDTHIENIIVGSHADYVPAAPEIPFPEEIKDGEPVPRQMKQWMDLMHRESMPPDILVDADDIATLIYTSGTTGVSKGCIHTNKTVMATILASFHILVNTSASIHLASLPLFHVTGLIHSYASLYAGGTLVLLARWNKETAIKAIETYQCSHWINITAMVIDVLSVPSIASHDLSSLLIVGGGGAPLPKAIGEKLQEMTGITYSEGYGLSESISTTHSNPLHRIKLQCLGIPIFGVEALLINPETRELVQPGETGELLISGPSIMKGYWNNQEETERAFIEVNGATYLRTGDICYMDEDGYFFIVDRAKRMINRAGFKVWPTAVEATLYKHPAINEVCIIKVPKPRVNEEVKAVIVLREEYIGSVTAEEIIDWAKERMSAYSYPRIVEFVDKLPKSTTGKILWKELEEKQRLESGSDE